jgi:hypothetical protein
MNHIKIILLCCVVFIVSCKKIEPILPTVSSNNKEFFSVSENTVKNGDIINFTLTTVGTYTLTMIDTVQNQVVSRERFTSKIGINSLKIYTNSLPTKYLSIVLKDGNNNQIGKTKIIIN